MDYKSKVKAVNKIFPIYLLIIYCSFLFALQNIELLFFSNRGAMIAILHCLVWLSARRSEFCFNEWSVKKNLPPVQVRKSDKSPFWSKISCAGFCLHFLLNSTSLSFLCMLHKVCSALWLQNAVTKCQSVKTKATRRCSIITGRAINHRAWVFPPRFLINESLSLRGHRSFSVPVPVYIQFQNLQVLYYAQWL